MALQRDTSIVYPPGVRDLTEDISTDDLVRRLKECAVVFQNMSQEDDNSPYIPLALYLASDTFLKHRSSDVRLIVACCIADIFRVYAPEPPYTDMVQVKEIFEFFVDQLKGLNNPQNPSYKHYFYLLENFSCVKTFNICVELEENQEIIYRLFQLMFKIIDENPSAKVKKFALDLLAQVIAEVDLIPQELLDLILLQIIEPIKSQNKNACLLARDIIQRTSSTLEPYIHAFFTNALLMESAKSSDVSPHLYDMIYELHAINRNLLDVVVPQLEQKLKSADLDERFKTTRVLARMFSDKNSDMIEQYKSLWACFLGRFRDVNIQIRSFCCHSAKNFLLNHPEAKTEIADELKLRNLDHNEDVRFHVIGSIVATGMEDFSAINDDLLAVVKERTLDKKFRNRREAVMGLAKLYKQYIGRSLLSPNELKSLSWIKNKIFYGYYRFTLEDRQLVERVLHTCLVPYQNPMDVRMKMLYQLYCSIDERATRAFKEILKTHKVSRNQAKILLETINQDKNAIRDPSFATKVTPVARILGDPEKSSPFILRFCHELQANIKLRSMMYVILNGNVTCAEADNKVREILKAVGNSSDANGYCIAIKQLFEKIAPVMIDKEGVKHLVHFVKDSLLNNGEIDTEMGLQSSAHKGLDLLLALALTYPATFFSEQVYNSFLLFLQIDDDYAIEMTLQILTEICTNLAVNFPDICRQLMPLLENFAETGNPKQAKHSVRCVNSIVCDKNDKLQVFGNLINILKPHLHERSQHFRTALVSIGHIAFLCHDMFASDFKTIITNIVVKELLMKDRDVPRGGEDILWGEFESLPEETQEKIEGMKVMVRWLSGLKDVITPATSSLKLFETVIFHGGDLMKSQHTSPKENAWMRAIAASCMLKLCQEPNYAAAITLDQFNVLAHVMIDDCFEVREKFALKLNKGLTSMKLPLQFIAILSLGGLSNKKEFKSLVKKHLASNIFKRREFVKSQNLKTAEATLWVPDYVLQYTVHLLAHLPFFQTLKDLKVLNQIKECLSFILEMLVTKTNYAWFKRLLENIKQTKDKRTINKDRNQQELANSKLYAVCDLALHFIMSQNNLVLTDFKFEPLLNSKFFIKPDKNYINVKNYLPPEFLQKYPMKSRLAGVTNNIPSTPQAKSQSSAMQNGSDSSSINLPSTSYSLSLSHDDPSIQCLPSTSYDNSLSSAEHSALKEINISCPTSQNNSKCNDVDRHKHKRLNEIGPVSQRMSKRKIQHNTEELMDNSSMSMSVTVNESKNMLDNMEVDSSIDTSIKSYNSIQKIKNKLCVKNNHSFKKMSDVTLGSTQSSELSNVSDLSSTSSQFCKSILDTQNGTAASSPASTSTSDFQHLLKECKVSLSKDEVENYAAKSSFFSRKNCINSIQGKKNSEELLELSNDLSNSSSLSNQTSDKNLKSNTRSIRKNNKTLKLSPSFDKRKRDNSPSVRSLRRKTSSSALSSKNPINSPIKNGMPSKEVKGTSKAISNHVSASPKNSKSSTVKARNKRSAGVGNKGSKAVIKKNKVSQKQTPTKSKKLR